VQDHCLLAQGSNKSFEEVCVESLEMETDGDGVP
jgi:hypothetical protein